MHNFADVNISQQSGCYTEHPLNVRVFSRVPIRVYHKHEGIYSGTSFHKATPDVGTPFLVRILHCVPNNMLL